jgi:group I intron endonuclease
MGQGYIGVSKNAEKRFAQHLKRPQNRHLKFVIKKYGWENLNKSILLYADKSYCLEIEKKLRPTDQIGWNLVAGGGHPPVLTGPQPKLRGRPSWNKGKKLSAETRAKLSAATKKQMSDPEHRLLLSKLKLGKPSPAKGRKHTPDTIEKMRQAKVGKPSKKKGTKMSPENYEKCLISARFQWECPHCKKVGMGKGAASRWHFDNCKGI